MVRLVENSFSTFVQCCFLELKNNQVSANQAILSRKNGTKNRIFQLLIDFWVQNRLFIDFSASKIGSNRLFGPKKLAPCKVSSKISFMKCREVSITGAPLKIRQPVCLFYRLKSTFWPPKSTFYRLFRPKKIDFKVDFRHPKNRLFSTSLEIMLY